MKHALLDIVYTTAYFSFFVYAVFTKISAANGLYELGYSVSSTLASSGSDTITSNSTMKFINIQTISDTFGWLTDTFAPSVFVPRSISLSNVVWRGKIRPQLLLNVLEFLCRERHVDSDMKEAEADDDDMIGGFTNFSTGGVSKSNAKSAGDQVGDDE
ncbi:Polycystic kidney disease 2 1 protein [Globisporangium polare]